MSWRQWSSLHPTTPIGKVIDKINDFLRGNAAVFTGGDRAEQALNSDAELTTNVTGTATIAGKSAGGVAATYSVEFQETFETEPADWTVLSGTRAQSVVNTGQTGGKAIRQTGPVAQAYPWTPLPYDATKLHRLRAKVKRVSGAGTFSYGVQAIDAAGAVLGTYALAALSEAPGASYTEYTGWLKGHGSTVAPATDPTAPSALPSGTVAIRPYYALNTGDASGVMDLDSISYDRQDEEALARTYNALLSPTDPADAARFATGARVQADGIDSDAIQTDVEIVGLLWSMDDPTVYIDLRTGQPPGTTIVSLPGFTADNSGNAVFDGEVAAQSFTSETAEFKRFLYLGVGATDSGHLYVVNTATGKWLTVRTRDGTGYLNATLEAAVGMGLVLAASAATRITLAGNHDATAPTFVDVVGDLDVSDDLTANTVSTGTVAATGAVSGASGTFTTSTLGAASASSLIISDAASVGSLSATGTIAAGGTISAPTFQTNGGATLTGAKPTVSGSWSGGTAGPSLAAALATLGLITDTTTA